MPTRNDYIKLIHVGAHRLGYLDDADYRAWLESLTGRRSTKDCTMTELSAVANTLRACNALNHPRIQAVQGATITDDRPTKVQWSVANRRCQALGMTGCDDERFTAFAKKVCKVDHPRFLTREAMRKLIAALNNWIANNGKKEMKS
ncbi:phage protein GemA/Gp16 family protein [Undibacterium sp. Ji49W]|uniref:phage protein GemA/Gp16 family protein n=1 Tax=Undibacterium sp. Ji49W TaxID=3413040 RepID=UPI003BF2C976